MRMTLIGLLMLLVTSLGLGCRDGGHWDPATTGTIILTVEFKSASEGMVKAIPKTASQLRITVTGPGQDPVSQTKPLVANADGVFDPVQFVLNVPAGEAKTITAEATKDNGFVVGMGAATGDLPAGGTVEVGITLTIYGRLVIIIS